MAPFQGPGVRPDVLSPKNVWFGLICAQKGLKWGFLLLESEGNVLEGHI